MSTARRLPSSGFQPHYLRVAVAVLLTGYCGCTAATRQLDIDWNWRLTCLSIWDTILYPEEIDAFQGSPAARRLFICELRQHDNVITPAIVVAKLHRQLLPETMTSVCLEVLADGGEGHYTHWYFANWLAKRAEFDAALRGRLRWLLRQEGVAVGARSLLWDDQTKAGLDAEMSGTIDHLLAPEVPLELRFAVAKTVAREIGAGLPIAASWARPAFVATLQTLQVAPYGIFPHPPFSSRPGPGDNANDWAEIEREAIGTLAWLWCSVTWTDRQSYDDWVVRSLGSAERAQVFYTAVSSIPSAIGRAEIREALDRVCNRALAKDLGRCSRADAAHPRKALR